MAQVSGKIIQELLLILTPFMRDKQQRQAYLELALGTNSPVLNLLVWDTSADVFIPQMVNTLVAFGEIIPGKPALCALLEVVRGLVGLDKQLEIDNLLQRIREELQRSAKLCRRQSPSNSSGVSPLFPRPEFQTYLENIAQKYQQWSNMYTLTDVEGKVFDVGLMVQTRQPKQREGMPGEGKQEKVELLPVLEGIRKYAKDHVLLIGKPGSGKSTALQRLLWEEAQAAIQGEKRKIPVLVELRNWDTSVETLIYKFLRKHKQRVDINKIEDLLLDDELLLLMDGLNELPSDEARDKVARFRQDYPETLMIFTTRDLGVGGSLGIDKQLEMQPLTEAQMREFVLVYLPEQGEQMLQQLGNRLRELGETPLILKMLCDVFIQKREIPKSRGDLFRQFDSTVNKLKEEKETVPVAEGLRRWKAELLQHLAFVMMQPENPQANPTNFRLLISRSQAETILEDFLKGRVEYPAQKAKDWLEGLLKHCLLESKASESEQVLIQFHHQLFQEYYAAEYLLRLLPNLSDAKLKRDYLNYLKWTESIAIALALVEDEALALRVVRLALGVDLMLGARLAGEVKREFQEKTVGLVLGIEVHQRLKIELLGMTRSEFAITSVKQALNHESTAIRLAATNALGRIGTKTVISGLLNALDDENANVYQKAAEWLGYLNCEDAHFGLLQKLESWELFIQNQGFVGDNDISVWVSLVEALGKISKEDAFFKLRNKLLKELDKNPLAFFMYWASGAGKVLRRIDSDVLLPEIFEALQDKNSDSRRQNAAFLLGQLDNKTAIPNLLEALEIENHDFVSQSILNVLTILDKNVVIPYLLKDLQDTNRSENAAKILIALNSEAAIPDLRRLLTNPDENISWIAAVVLGKLGRKEALKVLSNGLTYHNPHVRETAAEVLGELGDQEAIPPLYQALQDKYYYVRRSAAIALGTLGCKEAIPELLKALRHYQMSVNSSVKLDTYEVIIQGISEEELGRLGDEKAIERWLFEFRSFSVFIKVAEALGKLHSEEAISGLIKALENSSYAAAIALGKLGRKEAISTLLKYFRSSHPGLRDELVSALENFDDEEVIQELISALNDKDYNICLCAAKTLRNIASYKALSHLWQMQREGKEDVVHTIGAIQERCKFYNHQLFHSPPIEETKSTPTSSTTIINSEIVQIIEKNEGDVIGKKNN
ncbi:MAG: NACHT domain-containing protein [Scytonema sp. RU_4_4]|nr:NACHT domain-containing protein [Scytonema sp. RU_4_4]